MTSKKKKSTQPFFSIIIVNYNYGEMIEDAILSILNQSCQDYELIIVDGGSTDQSVDIIKKYNNKIAWWISEPDKGQSDAFNKGFSHAKGLFYTWLNADDIMLPNALMVAYKTIMKNPKYEWFAANTIFINSFGKIEKCFCGTSYSNTVLKKGNIEVSGPSTFFHRKLFNTYGPFNLDCFYTMDTDLWEKFVLAGYTFKRINYFCWIFRMHNKSKTAGSLSGNIDQKFYIEEQQRQVYNGIKKRSIYIKYQTLKKMFFCYPKSLYYTIKYKNKPYKNFFE